MTCHIETRRQLLPLDWLASRYGFRRSLLEEIGGVVSPELRGESGRGGRTRTGDFMLPKHARYQLRYTPHLAFRAPPFYPARAAESSPARMWGAFAQSG